MHKTDYKNGAYGLRYYQMKTEMDRPTTSWREWGEQVDQSPDDMVRAAGKWWTLVQ